MIEMLKFRCSSLKMLVPNCLYQMTSFDTLVQRIHIVIHVEGGIIKSSQNNKKKPRPQIDIFRLKVNFMISLYESVT